MAGGAEKKGIVVPCMSRGNCVTRTTHVSHEDPDGLHWGATGWLPLLIAQLLDRIAKIYLVSL